MGMCDAPHEAACRSYRVLTHMGTLHAGYHTAFPHALSRFHLHRRFHQRTNGLRCRTGRVGRLASDPDPAADRGADRQLRRRQSDLRGMETSPRVFVPANYSVHCRRTDRRSSGDNAGGDRESSDSQTRVGGLLVCYSAYGLSRPTLKAIPSNGPMDAAMGVLNGLLGVSPASEASS